MEMLDFSRVTSEIQRSAGLILARIVLNIANKVRFLWTRAQLLKRDRWSRQQLEAHQARTLADLRSYVYARSPFTRDFTLASWSGRSKICRS
jgi:hypothetical protein